MNGLVRTVSPKDEMFNPEQEDAYFDTGDSAVQCICLAMDAVGKETVSNILDFPCGHGRVLRALAAAFPQADLTACDIDRDGVDFCKATFAATSVYSSEDLSSVQLGGGFDLIWVGSLFTHLPDMKWWAFLDFLTERLAPEGLLVFTTHGPWCAQQIRENNSPLGGARKGHLAMLRGYDATGFGFAGFKQLEAYGNSLATPAAVAQRLQAVEGLRLVLYLERGWSRFQDVIACQKGFSAPRPRPSGTIKSKVLESQAQNG
jgi:SAM-dependent methyltransferase